MGTVKEKIAYLRGLIQGSETAARDPGMRAAWERMLEVMDDLADAVESLKANVEETQEYVEAIDDDLWDLEEELHGDWDEDDDLEVICPNCRTAVLLDDDALDSDGTWACPECGTALFPAERAAPAGESAMKDGERAQPL